MAKGGGEYRIEFFKWLEFYPTGEVKRMKKVAEAWLPIEIRSEEEKECIAKEHGGDEWVVTGDMRWPDKDEEFLYG